MILLELHPRVLGETRAAEVLSAIEAMGFQLSATPITLKFVCGELVEYRPWYCSMLSNCTVKRLSGQVIPSRSSNPVMPVKLSH
jgi:hypothetical protein